MNILFAMFPSLANHITEIKLTLVAMVGLSAAIADATNGSKGWEDYGLKGLCIVAVIAIGKLFLDERKESKEARTAHALEIKGTWDAHKKELEAREERLLQHLSANTDVLGELRSLTKEQTEYNKTVARQLIESAIRKPNLPG